MLKNSLKISFRSSNFLIVLFCVFEVLIMLTNVKIIPFPTVIIAILEFIALNFIFIVIIFKFKYRLKIYLAYILYYLLFGYVLLKHGTSFEYFFSLTSLIIGLIIIILYSLNNKNSSSVIFSMLSIVLIIKGLLTPFGDPNLELKQNQLNPNGMGFFLLMIFCYIFTMFLCGNKKRYLFISILILVAQVFYLSRNSLLFSVFYALAAYISKKFNYNFTYKGTIVVFLLLFQIFFVYFYSHTLFNMIGKGNLLIFGKDIFTGREVIWSEAFNQLSSDWLFGIGNTFVSSWLLDGKPTTNLHNSALAILVNFGFFVLLYVSLVIGFLSKRIKSKYTFLFLCCILGASYFDTILFSSSNVTIILIGFLCVNSVVKENKKYVNT